MKLLNIGDNVTFMNSKTSQSLTATVVDVIDGNVPTPIVEHPDYGLVQLNWTKRGWIAEGLE